MHHDIYISPSFGALVRRQWARFALAPHERPLPHHAFGVHPAADANQPRHGLLSALCRTLSHSRTLGSRKRGGSASALARLGILQPGPTSACRSQADCPGRLFPSGLWLRQGPARRGRLHRSCHHEFCLRRALCCARRQRATRPGPPLRHRRTRRHHEGEEAPARPCRRDARPSPSRPLQPGHHGLRCHAVQADLSALRHLSVLRHLSGAQGAQCGHAARQVETHSRPRPVPYLYIRAHEGRLHPTPPTWQRRHLAGSLRVSCDRISQQVDE